MQKAFKIILGILFGLVVLIAGLGFLARGGQGLGDLDARPGQAALSAAAPRNRGGVSDCAHMHLPESAKAARLSANGYNVPLLGLDFKCVRSSKQVKNCSRSG